MGSNLTPNQVRFNCLGDRSQPAHGREREFKWCPAWSPTSVGHLSTSAPLGRALLGKKVGDRVEVPPPVGPQALSLLAIRMDKV